MRYFDPKTNRRYEVQRGICEGIWLVMYQEPRRQRDSEHIIPGRWKGWRTWRTRIVPRGDETAENLEAALVIWAKNHGWNEEANDVES